MTHVIPASSPISLWTYHSLDSAGTLIEPLAALLAAADIELRSIPMSTVEPVATSLKALLRSTAQPPTAVLCLTERRDAALAMINRVCCSANVPLVLADPHDGTPSIGPGVICGSTPCLRCLDTHENFLPFVRPVAASASVAGAIFVERLAAELRTFISNPSASLLRQAYLLWFSPTDGMFRPSRILKDPACAVCSIAGRYPTEIVHTNQYTVEHAH